MTYANDLPILDADSHLMEPLDWLAGYADPDARAKLLELDVSAGGGRSNHDLVRDCWARRDDPEATAKLAADVVGGPKGYFAFGSMDPAERVAALDQLGYVGQLVFSTFAPNQFNAGPGRRTVNGGGLDLDLDLVYGGARAHNRGIVDFCAGDRRLRPVGFVPLDNPERSVACLNEALDLGIAAAWVPHGVPAEKSPTHPDFDGLWARLAEAGSRCCSTSAATAGPRWPAPTTTTAATPARTSSVAARASAPRTSSTSSTTPRTCWPAWCSTAPSSSSRSCAAASSSWAPAGCRTCLRSLDHAVRGLRAQRAGAGQAAPRPLRLHPPPGALHAVALRGRRRLIDSCGPDLFLFSSDWPHPEGGRDPLAEFRSSLDSSEIGPAARHRFYYQNLADLLGAPA